MHFAQQNTVCKRVRQSGTFLILLCCLLYGGEWSNCKRHHAIFRSSTYWFDKVLTSKKLLPNGHNTAIRVSIKSIRWDLWQNQFYWQSFYTNKMTPFHFSNSSTYQFHSRGLMTSPLWGSIYISKIFQNTLQNMLPHTTKLNLLRDAYCT